MKDLEENTEVEVEIELPYTLELKKPIELINRANGKTAKTITEVTFQNDLTADMIGHFRPTQEGSMPMKDFYPVISQMTGELERTVGKFGFADIQAAIEVVSHFLADGQSTGDNL